jgi:hypothetical protein
VPVEAALLWAQLTAVIFTAVATIALVYFTSVLARETRRLSDATAQPFVVATLEPNQWSLRHIDLRIENTGNAAAFNVKVRADPKIGQEEASSRGGLGMDEIDVLRPAQSVSTYVSEASETFESKYRITVEWRRKPDSAVETISYSIDMRKYKRMSRLGASSPLHQIAEEIKRSREDWRAVAHGQRRLEVDTFSEDDREAQRRRALKKYKDSVEERNEGLSAPAPARTS